MKSGHGDVALPVERADDEDMGWIDGIDICEHHCIDFEALVERDVRVVIARAGRGTRQDARWIETVRGAWLAGLGVGSYWHLYPSHTDAHHQAELWAAAVRAAPWTFHFGHWADITTTDGFEPFEMGRYVAAFLRRADELIGSEVGVFTAPEFWRHHVRFDDPGRPRWVDMVGSVDTTEIEHDGVFGLRRIAADRGGPGRHQVWSSSTVEALPPPVDEPRLVPRGPTETPAHWQERWVRTPKVALLQMVLNELGAGLVVDGVYGPATDTARRTCDLLRRRDGIEQTIDAAFSRSVVA